MLVSEKALSPGRRVFERLSTLLCYGVVIGYCCLLVISPAFGPNDDHRLLDTIQVGKPLPLYITSSDGRFVPLVVEEYWLLAKFAPSPLLYYSYNAAQLIVFFFLFRWVLRQATSSKALSDLATLGVLLAPGFPMAWFRLHVPERNVVFFLTLFLAAFLALGKASRPWPWFLCGLVAGNIALYYKEPVCVLLAVFSLFHLLGSVHNGKDWQKRLGLLMLAGCCVFVVLYVTLVLRDMTGPRYGSPSSSAAVFLVQAAVLSLINNPAVLLLVLPLLGARVYLLASGKDRLDPVFDPMLLAGVAYMGVFLVLRIDSPYYFLPAYVFVMPALVHGLSEGWLSKPTWTFLGLVTTGLILSVGFVTTLRVIGDAKYWPINLTHAADALAANLKGAQPNLRRKIVLLDVKRDDGLEMYVSFNAFLHARGVKRDRFCVASSGRLGDHVVERDALPVVPFIDQESCGASTEKGDFVVVIPYMSHIADYGSLFTWLERQHRLIFRSESKLAFPNLLRFLKDLAQGRARPRDALSSPAYYPDFFIFERV